MAALGGDRDAHRAFRAVPGRRRLIPLEEIKKERLLTHLSDLTRAIACDIERIPIASINDAYERMIRGDVKYRFVIDMASLPRERS